MNAILHKNYNYLGGNVIDYFRNINYLDYLYKYKALAVSGKKDFIPLVDLRIDIIENEIIGILQKPLNERSNEEKEIIRLARSYYRSLYKIYPEIAINVNLYRNNIKNAFFDNTDLNDISNFTYNVSVSAKRIYDKFIIGNSLSDKEQIIMFNFFTANIGTKSENLYNAQRNVIKKILSMEDNYHITGKNFYLQFINHEKCKRLNIPDARVYIGNVDINGKSHRDSYGLSYGDTGIISINQSFISNSPRKINFYNISYDVKIAQTMFHELEHYYQWIKMNNKEMSVSSFNSVRSTILRRFLSDSEYNEYMDNYKFNEQEREANVRGWYDTVRFLEKYGDKNRINDINRAIHLEISTDFEKRYGIKKDKKGVFFSTEVYNIYKLKEIVNNNPKLVSEYPQLEVVFNRDGNLKSFTQLVHDYTNLYLDKNKNSVNKSNKLDMYNEFFDYLFGRNDLSKLKLNNFNYDEQMMIFILIRDSYTRECRNLKNMMDVYPFVDNRLFDKYAKIRIDRIKKYYNFICSNQDYIMKLSSLSNVKSFGLLSTDNINRDIESFEERINKNNKYLKGTLLEGEIRNLSKMMGEDEYGRIYGEGKAR